MSGRTGPHTREPLDTRISSLDVFFRPRSVALIGATERANAFGRLVFENLRSARPHFPVYAVNLKRPTVLGRPAYRTLMDVPGSVDLAVIVTPAETVPQLIRECASKGVKGAIVISAGFRETGESGWALEQQVLAEARAGGVRLVGPNCLGVMRPSTALNATFAGSMAADGTVAFVSQSGALCTAMLDWSEREVVGFSAFMSVGSMVDVGWGDLIRYLGEDAHTKSIVLYMETIGDARSFLSAAREVALSKPIIVIKAGRTEVAARAAASHTGSLAGRDEVLDTALRRCGVLRVTNISDVFYMVDVLAKQPRPQGPRLTIVTNAGGPGVLATDSLISNGGRLAELPPSISGELDDVLPSHWSHGNPIDLLGDADSSRYGKAVDIAAKNLDSDGLLVIMTPQGMTSPTSIAEKVRQYATGTGKPILASWMGGPTVAEGVRLMSKAGIPMFPYPDTAAKAFCYLWQYSDRLRSLYGTPSLTSDERSTDQKLAVESLISNIRQQGRTLLDESESKAVLSLYGIPTVQTAVARTESEAVAAATRVRYPVVLKLYSRTVTHKAEVGGVKLNLLDEAAVRSAFLEMQSNAAQGVGADAFEGVTVQPMVSTGDSYELILGSTTDPQFGPVLLFGSGGKFVELHDDLALALPPLNTTLARRMMERTRVWKMLKGIRGSLPVDTHMLEEILVRFGRLVSEQPQIQEIDINPLVASGAGFLALDARIIVHDPAIEDAALPRLAIRPYPVQHVKSWLTKDNVVVTIRPIRPEDETRMIDFHQRLSERTVYLRYFHHLKLQQRIAHERLARICFVDYDRQIVMVAERTNPGTGQREIVAVARLVRMVDPGETEFAIVVADDFQCKGLGTELLRTLIQIAREEGIKKIQAEVLAENAGMVGLFRKLGFELTLNVDEAVMLARMTL